MHVSKLFWHVEVLGVARLRITSTAVIFGLWRRPWKRIDWHDRPLMRLVMTWGIVLAAMNCVFYLAIANLPLGTVAAIEFLPVILLAALGSRSRRNKTALILAIVGVYLLKDVVLAGEPMGVLLAFTNAGLFAVYIAVGHRALELGRAPGSMLSLSR